MRKKVLTTMLALAFSSCFILSACNNQAVSEHEHVWDAGTITTPSTCHSEGLQTFKCTVKGCKQTKTNSLAMLPHNWNQGEVTTQPTCTTAGVKTYTCLNDGCGQTKTEALEKSEHNYQDHHVTEIPDLLVKGEKELQCTVCHDAKREELAAHADFEEQFGYDKYSWDYASLTGFDPADEEINPEPLVKNNDAYESTDGNIKITKGNVKVNGYALLGYEFNSDAEMIEAGADIIFHGKDDATRVEAYLLLVDKDMHVRSATKISQDNQHWSHETDHDAFALNKGDAICLLIKNENALGSEGSLSFTITAECVHLWNDGEIIKEATYDDRGLKEYTCVLCGEKKQQVLDRLVPESDPLEDYFSFFDKYTNWNEQGYAGNSWTTEIGHTLHVEVSQAGENIWECGTYVNTGFTLVANKAYAITFEVSNTQEEDFEILFQNQQRPNEKVYKTLYSPDGVIEEKIVVDNTNSGSLWIYVQSGNAVNEIIITKLLIEETTIEPEEYYDFKDADVYKRFEAPVVGNAWIDEADSTKAHVEVTKPSGEIWPGGTFVKIEGVTTAADEEYNISFNLYNMGNEPLEIVVQNAQWGDEHIFYTIDNPNGDVSEDITIPSTHTGELWLYVRFGNVVNEVVLSNLRVQKEGSEAPAPFIFNYEVNFFGRFDGGHGVEGGCWVDEKDDTKLHIQVTKANHNDAWKGSAFIDTGIDFVEGHTYQVSYTVELAKEKGFVLELRKSQWEETDIYGKFDKKLKVNTTITVEEGMDGTLWFYFEFGDVTNKLTLSKLSVTDITD